MKDNNMIELMLKRMRDFNDSTAIIWQDQEYSYIEFLDLIDKWRAQLSELNISRGSVCGFIGDYSPQICALIFSLIQVKAILVPFTQASISEFDRSAEMAGLEFLFRFDENDNWTLESFSDYESNKLVTQFSRKERSGMIFFTSGSTGKPKGILHDSEKVMQKFVTIRKNWRTVLFLLMDHFGGFNTFLGVFAYGGVAICPVSRSSGSICHIIEKNQATLLPTTPTFLNMILTSVEPDEYDLSSLKLITYGTELMNDATLQKVKRLFPSVQLKQTYGLSELGVLRSRSSDDGSLWVKIGGEGFEIKVSENTLWVRSESNMVGYLNKSSPFDEEGWFCTGDEVEQKGEYIRFLGRKSEVINVGGQKVSPAEIESVLLEAENIKEATAYAVSHPIFGQVVNAQISLFEPEDEDQLSLRLRRHCLDNLVKYKVPMRFVKVNVDLQRSIRFKKVRNISKSEN
jgi:long-chain acyl-CoA synthetase